MGLKKYFSRKKNTDEDDSNPWKQPTRIHKEDDSTSFVNYVKSVFHSFSNSFGGLGRTKIHVRFLRQTKRVGATILFFLYGLMGLAAFPNPMFILFLATSFLMLDYLWKSRNVTWKKEQ